MKYPVGTRLVFTPIGKARWTVVAHEPGTYFLSLDVVANPVGIPFNQFSIEGPYWHTEEEYAILAGLFAHQINPFVKSPKKKARCINP